MRRELTEYTQVIIQEAERLQSLIDRLLTPHRIPQVSRSISTKCWSRCAVYCWRKRRTG